jgi:heat shock protein HslJ
MDAPGGSPGATEAATIEGVTWRLTSYAAPGGELVAVPESVEATARFEAGHVSGSAGCNTYGGSYELAGARLTLGPLAMTRKACPPPQSDVEQGLASALGSVAGCAVGAEALELLDADGAVLLRFEVAPVASLVGTRWIASMINNGRGAVSSLVVGTRVDAEFGADGRVHGSGGCNRYSGSYALDGATLSFSEVASTMMLCLEPEGVGEQEAAYFAALARVTTFRIEGDRLQLRDVDGALQVDFRAASE